MSTADSPYRNDSSDVLGETGEMQVPNLGETGEMQVPNLGETGEMQVPEELNKEPVDLIAEYRRKCEQIGLLSTDEALDVWDRVFTDPNSNPSENIKTFLKAVLPSGTEHVDLMVRRIDLESNLPVLKDHPHVVLMGRLDKGGMGQVYRAFDMRMKCNVAVKVSPQAEPSAYEKGSKQYKEASRFKEEAKNYVKNEDTGDNPKLFGQGTVSNAQGNQYMIMELIKGQSLSSVAKGLSTADMGKVPVSFLRKVFAQGLGAIYRSKVIHRDIKPGNILVRDNGELALVDAGLAIHSDSSRHTETGAANGTAEYMSFEQRLSQSENESKLMDYYSLIVTLLELANKGTPYSGLSPMQIMMMKPADQQKYLLPICTEIEKDDPQLAQIFRQGLNVNPAQRFSVPINQQKKNSEGKTYTAKIRDLGDEIDEKIGQVASSLGVDPSVRGSVLDLKESSIEHSVYPNNSVARIIQKMIEEGTISVAEAESVAPVVERVVSERSRLVRLGIPVGAVVTATAIVTLVLALVGKSGKQQEDASTRADLLNQRVAKAPETPVTPLETVDTTANVDSVGNNPDSWLYPNTTEMPDIKFRALKTGNFKVTIGNDEISLQDLTKRDLTPDELQEHLESEGVGGGARLYPWGYTFKGRNGEWHTYDIMSYSVKGVGVNSHTAKVNLKDYYQEIGADVSAVAPEAEGDVNTMCIGPYSIRIADNKILTVASLKKAIPTMNFSSPAAARDFLQNLHLGGGTTVMDEITSILAKGDLFPNVSEANSVIKVDPENVEMVTSPDEMRNAAQITHDSFCLYFELNAGVTTVASSK